MAIHKQKPTKSFWAFTECGRALHLKGGKACLQWKGVTCKNCLKHKKKNG